MGERSLGRWQELPEEHWERIDTLRGIVYKVYPVPGAWVWVVQPGSGRAYEGRCATAQEARAYADRYDPPRGLQHSTVVMVDVVPAHMVILKTAKDFAEQDAKPGRGSYEAAVILAQTACEVLTAQVIVALARARGDLPPAGDDPADEPTNIEVLETLADRLLPKPSKPEKRRCLSFNLGNGETRKIYAALTGDEIGTKPQKGKGKPFYPEWWGRLQPMVSLRNNVAHNGARASREQAIEACTVAVLLTTHLENIYNGHKVLNET